jgi:hypothetical protein
MSSMMHFDVPRPFNTGEQLVGDNVDEVFERSEIKADRITPAKLPGVAPPQPYPALGGDASILGPSNLTHPRFDYRRQTNSVA